MFDNLSQRLLGTVRKLSGRGRITEDNIKEALRDIRIALLEADVALPVVKQFIDHIKDKAVGQDVLHSIKPGEALVKIVQDELTSTLGEENVALNLSVAPPAVILMAGLQGSGKTTSTAKLARYLKEKDKKSVLVVSADVYRPAAIEQLATLAKQVDVDCFPSEASQKPIDIVNNALSHAKKQLHDVLIIDTAGRLHVDDEMMSEIKKLHEKVKPVETLFVVDSMTGQDAANTAKSFNDALDLTGVILTKIDGDARGGAALSIRHVTGKPIKFIGTGEKMDGFDVFHPDRLASRILDMGDIVSLVEEAQEKVDQKKAEKLSKKIKKGKGFDLQDFLEQLEQMSKMGGMAGLMSKLPGMQQLPKALKAQADDSKVTQMRAMIQSMTPKERRFPDVIKGSRKVRIANGSGTQVQDLNRLLKQFTQMQKMMKKMAKGGMMKMMRNMKGMMPPGMDISKLGGGGGMPPFE
ncbi:MAG: signal recognition particle protein [Legionellaceae bacterium]|nr:signal recognition particle protein [Legionellaceae bacterium]